MHITNFDNEQVSFHKFVFSIDPFDSLRLFDLFEVGNGALSVETMLTRKDKEVVIENAVLAKVARACWVYIDVSGKGFFLLHQLHLCRLNIQSKL